MFANTEHVAIGFSAATVSAAEPRICERISGGCI